MAASGYTPISLYYSTTASAVPTAGNLANGELALNIADMKLYAKNSSGTVTLLASNASTTGVDSLSFGSTGLTPSTATTGAITVAGTLNVANGGTGLTSFTSGGVVYASSTSALTTGSALTFDGTNFSLGGGTALSLGGYQSLNLNGSTSGILNIKSNGTDNFWLFSDGSNQFIDARVGSQIYRLNGTEQMRLTSTGLGIGTSSPGFALDIAKAKAVLRVQSTTATNAAYMLTSNNGGDFYMGRENSAGTEFGTTAYSSVLWSAGAYPMAFFTNGIERMRLDSAGNLGVGTTSPFSAANQTSITINATTYPRLDFYSGGTQRAFLNSGATDTNLYTVGSTPITFGTNNTERARIDSSGNLGLGVTPSAFTSTIKALQIGPTSVFRAGDTGYTQATFVSSNARQASAVDYYIANGYASQYGQQAGAHYWYTAASGTAGNAISFTQAMTLDASGNLGIGTTTPANPTGGKGFEISNASGASIRASSSTSNLEMQAGGSATYLISYGAFPFIFYINAAERARISAAGGFSVGTTADPGAGAIYATGNITAYYSDDRLKTRLGNIENALDKVDQLQGFYYEANETAQALGYKPKREVGVSAQSVQAVLPEIVSPAPIDQQYLTLDYERLVPLLIEAVKELRAEVKALKGV